MSGSLGNPNGPLLAAFLWQNCGTTSHLVSLAWVVLGRSSATSVGSVLQPFGGDGSIVGQHAK
jgi:hypothetical protein